MVEIWDRRHAEKILSVIADVFKDIENAVHVNTVSLYTEEGDDQYDFMMSSWMSGMSCLKMMNYLT